MLENEELPVHPIVPHLTGLPLHNPLQKVFHDDQTPFRLL